MLATGFQEQQYEITTALVYSSTTFNLENFSSKNCTNISKQQNAVNPKDLWREIPLGIFLTFLCLLTTVGNAVVLRAVRTERRLQSVSNMFIVSLAIADLIVGLFVMPLSTVYIFTEHWRLGVAVCQIWIGIDYIASTASILNLFILSLDRYWSVTSPLKYIRKRTKKRAVLMITVVWVLSSLWILPIACWHHLFNGGKRIVPSNVCDTEYAKNSALKVITAFFNFYLPLAVMYALYWKIFQEIRKRSELELGQRNGKYANACISTLNSCHDGLSFNEPNYDSLSENNCDNHLDTAVNHISTDVYRLYDIPKLSPPTQTRRSHFMSRFFSKKKPTPNRSKTGFEQKGIKPVSVREKIEYIYDENVIDEKTEKIERYFYEDFTQMKPLHRYTDFTPIKPTQRPNGMLPRKRSNISADLSISPPSTPLSSCSNPVEKRTKPKERYALASGLRRIREAESIIDTAVATACKKSSSRNDLTFRDERIRRSSNNIKSRINNVRQSSALTKEIKAARQLGVIMGAFTICFLPYFVLFLVVAFCDGCIEHGLLLAMTWIGYLNSTLNPFLYPLCNANFRRKFRMMLWFRTKRARYGKVDGCNINSITTAARYD